MKIATVSALLLLAGCATPSAWWRPNTTEAQFRQDSYACDQAAAMAYPMTPVQRTVSPGVQAQPNVRTTCRTSAGATTCTSSPAGGLDASIYNQPPTTTTDDANDGNRRRSFDSCLYAKGYSLRSR